MKKIFSTLAVAIFMAWPAANAVEVANTAGNLNAAGIDPNETTLTVTGTINAADFDYISSTLTKLTTLNLSGANITAYSGDPVLLNRASFEANTIPDYAFAGSKLENVTLPASATAIAEGAFSSSKLKNIVIPASVTSIGDAAFANCDQMLAISIPANVESLGKNLLRGCDALNTFDAAAFTGNRLPDGICADCPSLASVTLPPVMMAEIGDEAFAGCSALTEIQLPSLVEIIGDHAFEASGLTRIDFDDYGNLSTIGDWAFAKCDALTTAILPEGCNDIGEGAFFGSALESFTAATYNTKVSDYMLTGANKLSPEGVLPEGVTTIGRYAFAGWDQITDFTLPSTINYIDDNAFEGWTSLQNLYANSLSTVPALGENVWEGVDQPSATLVVKEELVNDFLAAEQWQLFHIDTTGVVAVTADGNNAANVKARFEGLTLVIEAQSDIATVGVFDTEGRKYALAQPAAAAYRLDTSEWSSPIYIIAVRLADGSEANFKLARR
ncbi:MAG: leucine-rich repeat domain-containing protein [Muribaculaceae bacterium]|nr:leucine-rich repeat domain-containing protein [Muribaculaceae bacterium]